MAPARRAARPRKPAWKPRKLPVQARSQATFDAILEATARILGESGLAAVTTNAVAARAGVSIGSLYEFFPNRMSILSTLTERRLTALARVVEETIGAAHALDAAAAVRLLIERLVGAVTADRALLRVLLREAPMLRDRAETQRALASFYEIGRLAAARAGARIDLPSPVADTWLIGRMVGDAVLEIAFADGTAPDRGVLVEELARLVFRMLLGRDIDGASSRASRR